MKGTPLTDAIVDYANELFGVEDELLRTLRREAADDGIPAIQISADQAAFMQVLLKSIGAQEVLEVGTLAGYSAIVMARALPLDGRVTTIERDPFHAEFAREMIRRAGLERNIDVIIGSGIDVLEKNLEGTGPYDFAFIDADKVNYVRYLELILPMMRTGGIIAGDNAMAWGRIAETDVDDQSVQGMQAFNLAMSRNPLLHSALVPIGDGMCIGVVRNGNPSN